LAVDPTALDIELDNAASLLRQHGWVCVPPAAEKPTEPEVGQTWVSPKPRIEPRTITKIAASRTFPWAGDKCVYFTTPSGRSKHLTPEGFHVWVRRAEARPA
jgi:hypothetical protein